MSDFSDDEIAKWAEGLSPEGSPGLMTQRMREYLGDQGYEKAVAQSDAVASLYLQKHGLYNALLSLAVVYVAIFGLVALVASVLMIIKFLF